ncbi:hypothetical protein V5799_007018 [Amblyomma americanum]|uniref:Chitin-binding type-2 domain-containing protein n=1 Tax=Amblyomma americanum TaxID=6943 RepID=A0AAQ4DUR2_AMBAM
MMQYSFVCPNNTVFDQQTLTCTPPPGSVPCHEAEKFYYLNQQVEQVGAPGLPQPAVVPVPKHEAPQHQAPLPHFQPPQPQQQLPKPQPKPEPAPLTPVDDAEVEVERPSSYYGKSG